MAWCLAILQTILFAHWKDGGQAQKSIQTPRVLRGSHSISPVNSVILKTNQSIRTSYMQYAICRYGYKYTKKNMTYSPISISIASGVSTVSTADVFRLARILIIFSIFCNKSSSRYGLIITSSIPAAFASSIWPWRAFPASGLVSSERCSEQTYWGLWLGCLLMIRLFLLLGHVSPLSDRPSLFISLISTFGRRHTRHLKIHNDTIKWLARRCPIRLWHFSNLLKGFQTITSHYPSVLNPHQRGWTHLQ